MSFAKSALALSLAACLLTSQAMAHSMNEEIDHLLGFIAGSPCAFLRNDVAYGGKEAVAHIKDKYQYYRNDIHSAEDFIALAASKSMITGKPYLVECDARTVTASDWLAKELAAFRQQP